MSTELTRARTQLGQIKTFLKQDKFIPAIQSLREALVTVLKQPLMRNEKDEFVRLVDQAVHNIGSNEKFRQMVPIMLEYTPGEEKALIALLKDLMDELQKGVTAEAQEQLAELERRKQEGLDKGQDFLDQHQYDEANQHFGEMVREFADDPALKGTIGEKFLRAGRYEEAYEYLAMALEDSPDSIGLYNSVGIALRKMGKFDTAEKYYSKALEYAGSDPNLYFNIGRLYLDWRKWDKVEFMAQQALKHNPDFAEAQKMLTFARKQMESQD